VRFRNVVIGALLLTVGSVPACEGRDPEPSATRKPTLNSPTPDARALAEQRALDAYRGMWQAYTAAGRAADPRHPDLPQFAADDALRALVTGLETNKRLGLVSRGDLVPHPQVTELTPVNAPTTAAIRDCLDTKAATRVKADGSPFTDTPGGNRNVTATVKSFNGTWKVTSLVPLGVGTC